MRSWFRSASCAVVLTMAALAVPPASPARAAAGVWEPLGPAGAAITALTVAPSNPLVLYSGTAAGRVYRSADAGESWADVTGTFPGISVADIEVDPDDPATVYVAVCSPGHRTSPAEGGLFKTVDAGETWTALPGLPCQVNDVAVDPGDSTRVLAATVTGLFQSNDGGASWSLHPGRPGRGGVAVAVAFDPATPGTVFVLHLQSGVLKSVNGGVSWTVQNAGLPAERFRYAGLAFSSATPKTVYLRVLTPGTPVFRSEDGGARWVPAANGLGGRRVYDLEVAPGLGTVYAATVDGVFRSADRGRSWVRPAPVTDFTSARVLAAPSAPAGVVYAGSTQSLFKSVDRGRTWSPINRGLPALAIGQVAVAPSDPLVLYARTEIDGIVTSRTGGASWQPSGPGLQEDDGTASLPVTLAVHPHDPRTAFAGGFGGIWKTTDTGGAWQRITGPDFCLTTVTLAIDPHDPQTLYAGGLATGCAAEAERCNGLKSTDGGASWSCMAGLPDSDPVNVIALAPSQTTTLYAGLSTALRRPVLKSADAGRTWRARSGGLPRAPVLGLVVSPEDASTVYVLLPGGIYKSTDGAGTWSRVGSGLPADANLSSLVIAPSAPSVLYVAAFASSLGNDGVVFRSADAGATWSPITREGLPPGIVRSLEVSPTDPDTVYAGTNEGVYRLVL